MSRNLKKLFLTTVSASSFKIQRGSFDFGASEDSDTVTITTVGSTSSAFSRITGVQKASGGVPAGDVTDKFPDDLGMTCLLTDTETITFTRYSTGENVDFHVSWEVWEYIGPSGGPNEFIVRYHDNITILTTNASGEQSVSGVDTLANCVPFICGIVSNQPTALWIRAACTAEMIAGDKVKIEKTQTSGTIIVSVAVIEFTGSNWKIQANIIHSSIDDGVDETETISDINDWNTAFIESGMRTNRTDNEDIGWTVRPGETTTTVRFRIRGIAPTHITIAHIIKNSKIQVNHLDSITGGETNHPNGSSSPQTIITNITKLNNLSTVAVIASADSDGITAEYPRPFWLYSLKSTTELEWWRGRHGSTSDWAAQIIQLP